MGLGDSEEAQPWRRGASGGGSSQDRGDGQGHDDHGHDGHEHDGHGHGNAHGHGHGHAHSHGPAAPASARLRRVIVLVLAPFAVAVLAGLVLLWPGGAPPHERTGVGFDQQTESGRVTKVERPPCEELGVGPGDTTPGGNGGPAGAGPSGAAAAGETGGAAAGESRGTADAGCQRATVEVTSGPHRGRTFQEIVRPDQLRRYTTGQEVVLAYAPKAPENLQYSVLDVKRGTPMTLLAGVFAVAVVAIGRMRGLRALVSLVLSFAVLTLFILPAILQGSNPLLVAVIGGSAIMLGALYLCHGFSARTSVAALGTLVSLLLIGLLGSLFNTWARLTGNTSDETALVHSLYPGIEIQGLLLASIIIGSLGVLDDVTVTQTSAVWELKQANPKQTVRQLYGAALRIGRDHIASTVNTLALAYAGASLPLLLLFSVARSDVLTVASSEVVAEEIVRTLVGGIGLVASVPVTTVLAALVASADRDAHRPQHGEPVENAASVRPRRGGRRRRS